MKRLIAVALVVMLVLSGCSRLNAAHQEAFVGGGFQIEAAKDKGLSTWGNYSSEYYAIRDFYMNCLNTYLDEKLDLTGLDSMLADHEYGFITDKYMNEVHSLLYSFNYSYIFLFVEAHPETLSDEDLLELQRLYILKEYDADFIGRTYPTVTYWTDNDNVKYIIDRSNGTAVEPQSLVVGIKTKPEFDTNGNVVDVNHEYEKEYYLESLREASSLDFSNILNYPVEVILYT